MTDNARTDTAGYPRRLRTRGGALALAAATATVLGVTAWALPALAAQAPARAGVPAAATASVPLKDGALDWGIKKSFRDYLTGPIANGKITVADGARTNADGTFRLTDGSGTYDVDSHAVTSAFHGSIHLYGHHGALDITLSGFSMETKGESGTLTADVANGTGEDGGGKPEKVHKDVTLADLDLSGIEPGSGEDGALTYSGVPATLTEGGSKAFEGYYPQGEKLDPVSLSVTPDSAGTGGSSGTGGSASGTGSASGSGGSTNGGAHSGGASAGGAATGSGGPGSTAGGAPGAGGAGGDGGSGSDSGGGASEQPASGTLVDGNLDWGVKASFRSYVTGPIAHGKVETTDGAEPTSGGYRFTQGGGDFENGSLNATFKGGVRFLGHKEGGAYSLDLTFSHLGVQAEGTKGSLVADVRSKDRTSGKVSTDKDVTVATLKLDSGALTAHKDVVTVKKAPATLTKAGAGAFGGFYEAGDALDPVTLAASLDENASLPGAGSGADSGSAGASGGAEAATTGGAESVGGTGSGADGSLASTGARLPASGVAGAAGVLAALGGGAVWAARRRTGARPAPAVRTES
ncbi:HtaA domain-containing protein [Streptomyces reniochalinae]|uniref:Htaa domain-containing protein n=1 Tax=Streptomyces reniochalinae TaxID=2250578 RepID=A0A367EYH0_9ACTN|nr:HtaA domain-containing protein [Streptomyces reniochalinae]RCG22220.1 hypothetical protein DQ392_06915 [Streptomyces reniochalinae]